MEREVFHLKMNKEKNEYQTMEHSLEPVYDEQSKILILGSFPSVKSREMQFYYGHPLNRFWKVLAGIFDEDLPNSIEEKTNFLKYRHIAVWDVILKCDIIGSRDSSIKNVEPTDLGKILATSEVSHIYTNGKMADRLYRKYQFPKTKIQAINLPSTSPANAACSFEMLMNAWSQIKTE